jgi:hypothetical protein
MVYRADLAQYVPPHPDTRLMLLIPHAYSSAASASCSACSSNFNSSPATRTRLVRHLHTHTDSEAAPPAAMARIPPLHGRRHWDGASGALRRTVALYLDVYASTNSAARSPPRERDVKRTRPVSYAGPSSSSALSFMPYAHTHNHTAQLTPRARTGAAAPGV